MTEALAEAVAGLPEPVRTGQPFQPGRQKTGGRRKGVANRDRAFTIERIYELTDPIGVLARIANGQPLELAPEPGKPPALIYPTLADMLQAATVLARKVMPDLKAVRVEDGGNIVNVYLELRQRTTVGQPAE